MAECGGVRQSECSLFAADAVDDMLMPTAASLLPLLAGARWERYDEL